MNGFTPAIDPASDLPKCINCNDRSEAEIAVKGPNYYPDCTNCNVDDTMKVKECLSCQSGFIYLNATTMKSECVTQCPVG